MDGLASPEFSSAQGRGLAGWPSGLGPARPGTPSFFPSTGKKNRGGERDGDRRRGIADSGEQRPRLEAVMAGGGLADDGESIQVALACWGGEERVRWWRWSSVRILAGEDDDGGDDTARLC